MKKIIPIMLALVIAVSAVGCSASKPSEDSTDETKKAAEVTTQAPMEVKSLKAERIGSIDSHKSISFEKGGVYYSDGEKYGIISADGKNDTGAIFTICDDEENYFEATKASPKESDIASLNCFGLYNDKGEEIIPENYASIEVMSEDFAKAIEVTEVTESKDDALVFISNSGTFAKIFPDEDDTMLKGNWVYYNLKTGEKIGDFTGTNRYISSVKGKYLSFATDDQNEIVINPDGEPIPEGATLFENGCYYIDNGTDIDVYDTEDKKLFSLDLTKYYIMEGEIDGFFTARDIEAETGDKDVYVVLNTAGDVVSTKFECESSFNVVNSQYVISDKTACDFQGNKILEGEYSLGTVDDEFNRVICFSTYEDSKEVVIDNNGNILLDTRKDEDVNCSFGDEYYYAYKNNGEEDEYFNFTEKDYSIKGYTLYKWLLESKKGEDDKARLIDTFNGDILIRKYDEYKLVGSLKTKLYAYAKSDNGWDVYQIS